MSGHQLVGWVSTPNVRGTLSIVYSCATVIVIAIWTILHLNVPAKTDSLTRTLLRRARWGVLAVFTPDLLTLVAASQWVSARSSVEQMRELNDTGSWTLVHAFYANSGGFLLQPQDETEFPVNAEQIHFLVLHGYIPLPAITRDEIWDKSKADLFAKGFALLQISWIIIQCVARVAGGLSVSPLEVFTIAFVVSTTMSYFYWWNKPQDVKTPTILDCKFSTARILADVGISPDAPYDDSPLDFVNIAKGDRTWERRRTFREYDLERQQTNKEFVIKNDKSGPSQTRVQRIPNDAILMKKLPLSVLFALAIPSLIHSTVHLLGWNFTYPSSIERALWRTSAVILPSVSAVAVAIVRMMAIWGYRGRYNLSWAWVNHQRREDDEAGCGDQFWDVFLSFLVFLLALARLYIIFESIASLRDLPADVFVTVEWADLIPHV